MTSLKSLYVAVSRRLLAPVFRWQALRTEMRRLEAFLGAAPAAFCGWNEDGVQAISPGFAAMLGADDIRKIEDFDPLLTPADAVALRDNFIRLRRYGEAFDLAIRSADDRKCFLVKGTRSTDLEGRESFDVLWLMDVTEQTDAASHEVLQRVEAEKEKSVLEAALDNIPYPVWMRDAKGEITWVNSSYASVVDKDKREIVTRQREASIARKHELWRKARESGSTQSASGHMVAQGERRLVEASESYLGREDIFVGTMIDLTRMEEAEAELQRHVEAHAEMLEGMGSAIAIYGSDRRLQFFNNAYLEMFDLDEKVLEGGPTMGDVLEMLREKRRLPEMADFQQYKRKNLELFTSLIDPMEDLIHLPSGAALRQVITPHPFGGLIVMVEDVSSRLALESSYNTLIAVQRETLDHLAEGLSVIGGDGRIKLHNPAFQRIWKLNEADLEGEPHISDLIEKMRDFFDTEEDWDKIKQDMIADALDRRSRSGRMERADGSVVEFSAVPLPDGAILNSYLDVSDSVRVEQALREKNAALQATDQLKTEFLANVSYKLRTPLNAVMGFSEILKQRYFGELNDKQEDYIDLILESSAGLNGLVNDILDLATIEAGYMILEREACDIKALAKEVKEMVEPWAEEQNVTIQFKIPAKLAEAEIDSKRIKQVLVNLISNAINFTPPEGKITVSASTGEDQLVLTVRDNGVGIPVQDQQRIFGSFERAHPEQGHAGTGLGLTLVKSFVELHTGYVELNSVAGEGTTIICHLPLTERIARLWEDRKLVPDMKNDEGGNSKANGTEKPAGSSEQKMAGE